MQQREREVFVTIRFGFESLIPRKKPSCKLVADPTYPALTVERAQREERRKGFWQAPA
jgi:hypothetical protein